MKLLSWIRTIKQNAKEFKGKLFSCLRADQVVSSKVQQDIRTDSFSFSGVPPSHHDLKPTETDEELIPFDEDDEEFSGFPTMGTLLDEDHPDETPKFTSTRRQKEIAKLLTEKLDKLLEEYPEDGSSSKEGLNAEGGDRESDPSQEGYDHLYPSSLVDEVRSQSQEQVKKKKVLLITSLFKKRRRRSVQGECNKTRDLRKNVQIYPRKVHPVLYTHERVSNEIDDRRSCNLKTPGGFLVSISEANRKREKWIKTDSEYIVLEL